MELIVFGLRDVDGEDHLDLSEHAVIFPINLAKCVEHFYFSMHEE